jgi:hypothetical protein
VLIPAAAPAAEPAPAVEQSNGDDAVASDGADEDFEQPPLDVARGPAAVRCLPPAGVSGSPGTIDELVLLLNSLPKLTTVACFLQSLDRPLDIYATRSTLSAQPAGGAADPRTFIIIDDLAVSIVPGGRASSVLEFGYRATEDRSVKGEIPFPIKQDLTDEQMVAQIELGTGSLCGGCHTREAPARGAYFEGAFESNVITPNPFYEVELSALRTESEVCDTDAEPGRCAILSGLFDHGEVRSSFAWPSNFR